MARAQLLIEADNANDLRVVTLGMVSSSEQTPDGRFVGMMQFEGDQVKDLFAAIAWYQAEKARKKK